RRDLAAQDGVVERHRHRDGEVVALAAEALVALDVDDQEQVARGGTGIASATLAADLDALAVLDARGDLDVDRATGGSPAGAGADLAGVLDDQTAAPALRARLGHREDATGRARLHAASLALAAHLGHRAGLGARPVTRRARLVAGEAQRQRRPLHRLAERDRGLGLEVLAPAGLGRTASTAAARPAAEDATEDVAQVEVGPAHAAGRAATGREAAPELAEQRTLLVVLLALLGIADDPVGLGDRLEPLLGLRVPGVGVGMVVTRELAVGLLDLVGRRVLADAEDLVEVLG